MLLTVLVPPCWLGLHAPPPSGDDPAFQRRMRESEEAVGLGDVCKETFHNVCVLRCSLSGREGGRTPTTRLPSSSLRKGYGFNAFSGVTSTLIR